MGGCACVCTDVSVGVYMCDCARLNVWSVCVLKCAV